MADAASSTEAEREPDTTPASETAAADATPAAAGTQPGAGVGDMALQRKTEVGPADDPMEQQADTMARRIMRATEPVPAPTAAPPTGTEVVRRQTATDAVGSEGGALPDSVRDYLDNSRGTGSPLPEATRRFFESRFEGAQFGEVRVHDDPGANEAARSIGAIAFTRNRDVYFAAGMYDPVSPQGRAILAHELTHVVQQTGASGGPPAVEAEAVTPDTPAVVRRTPSKKDEAAGEKKSFNSGVKGDINLDNSTLHIKKLDVPKFKAALSPGQLNINKKERPNDQIKVWEDAVREKVKTNVQKKVTSLTSGKNLQENKGPTYYLQYGKSKRYVIGSVDAIAAAILRPRWDREAAFTLFDVDHKLEWQLSGAHKIENMWLLRAKENRSSGSTIRAAIDRGIKEVVEEARPKLDKKPPPAKKIKKEWEVTAVAAPGKGDAGKPPHWEATEMAADVVTAPLELVPEKKVAELKGKANAVAIYTKPYGGDVRIVDPDKLDWKVPRAFTVTKVDAKEGGGGTVKGRLYGEHKRMNEGPLDANLVAIPGVEFGGYLDAKYATKNLLFNGLSPLDFEDAEFNPNVGLVGKAKIPTPSISLLKNTEIGVRVEGADVAAYAVITAEGLELPGPLQITGGALELSVGTKGFAVEGDVGFEIEKLGRGLLKAAAGSSDSFALSAELEVDTELFTKAEVKVHYRDGKWGGGGTLGVGEGKVKGIKSAEATVEVSEETVHAKGTFESSLKGLEKGTLEVTYDKEKGLEVAGQLGIGKLPGIEGGTIDAKVQQGVDGYSLSGGVTAKPSIPGVTGSVTGKYDDGAFLAEADLGYQRGMLNGRVRLGVTNQALSEGKPAGPPTANITAWGGGQVTIKIAPWLQGTIGLELDPQGRMTVKGEIGLPNQINLFDEKKVEKNIFKIGVDIPIVGVAVAGQRIGIFATIQGGLDASAGFGPGQLRALSLAVTYSPDDEAATTVRGKAEMFVPAHAGLRLFVRGGVGAGIPVVSATAGLEVSGALGLEGAAQANVDVDWNPTRGLVIDAKGSIFVEPKFRFAIEAFVDVEADLWLTTIEIYKKKWSLASFEYGSNLRFGVLFPVHYEQGKPFELSLSQVEFSYPSVDPGDLLKGLVKSVV